HEGMWAFHTKDSQTGEYLPVNPERGLYDITLTDGVLSFFYGTAAEFAALPYDLNADGTVNVGDVTTLVNIILGKASADGINTDLNGDGSTNVGDVTTLVNFILGK
ncbi:MAG: dockerin type I repeat-containing protein, partial [Alloprevotella sp.]|nr:dockerin type I repeat-containing protein [Alloprevotella sp.]